MSVMATALRREASDRPLDLNFGATSSIPAYMGMELCNYIPHQIISSPAFHKEDRSQPNQAVHGSIFLYHEMHQRRK
jgi:hypothetical protein